jgi:hypothetical protein
MTRRKDVMDFIPDPKLYAAVMFARKMIRGGTPPQIANSRAAEYYAVSASDVAHYTGQTAGRVAAIRKKKKRS